MNGSLGGTKRIMTPLPKICLAVSATGFAAGSFIDFGGFNVVPAVTVVLPLGAVFFGMFMIARMMEKEVAKFDEEAAVKRQWMQSHIAASTPAHKREPGFVQDRTASKPVSVPAA
jgi:hypothetical protein